MKKEIATEPLEKDIQRTICEWLDFNHYFFWRSNNVPVFSRNNAGRMAFRSLPKFTPRGLPDIQLIHKGNFVGIEIKRNSKLPLTDDQKNIEKCFIDNGAHYIKVSSVEEVMAYLSTL